MKKGNDRYSWSGENIFTSSAARRIIFHRENLNYLTVCFTLCILFFSIRLFSILGFHSREKAEKQKGKPFYTESLESGKWKKKICKSLAYNQVYATVHMRDIRKNVLPKFIKLCMETPCLCPFQGHKYGRRKPTDPSVFEFSYLCVNS